MNGPYAVVCIHEEGKECRAFFPRNEEHAADICNRIVALANARGVKVTAVPCPMQAPTVLNVTGFIEDCISEQTVTIPVKRPIGNLFPPPNAYSR